MLNIYVKGNCSARRGNVECLDFGGNKGKPSLAPIHFECDTQTAKGFLLSLHICFNLKTNGFSFGGQMSALLEPRVLCW